MVKKCPNCNQEVPEGVQVCPNCGEFIEENDQETKDKNAKKEANGMEDLPEENYPEEELKKQQKDERSDFGRTDK